MKNKGPFVSIISITMAGAPIVFIKPDSSASKGS